MKVLLLNMITLVRFYNSFLSKLKILLLHRELEIWGEEEFNEFISKLMHDGKLLAPEQIILYIT